MGWMVDPGKEIRASVYPPTGSRKSVRLLHEQTSAPEVHEASVRSRLPPETATFDAWVVTLFMWPPSIGDHFDVSRAVPSNSSSKTICHDPGTPSGEEASAVDAPTAAEKGADISRSITTSSAACSVTRVILGAAALSRPDCDVHDEVVGSQAWRT